MSSIAGIKAKECHKHCKQNEDEAGQTRPKFCQSLFYLLPCFRKKSSPASSRSSSKTSKHNFFLENHYIVKCPKKGGTQNKEDNKNEEAESAEETSDNNPEADKLPNQKEVRFLGAAKRHSERNDYLKLLGMEPNDYLNQFSSVFIKNLKSPIPKDPAALPKKYNVYVPPKKKSNRSLLSMNQVSDVRNLSHCPKPRRTIDINRSISSVVKEKCAAFQKNFDIFNKKAEEIQTSSNDASPCRISSIEDLDSTSDTLQKYSTNINSEIRSPWQCSNDNGLYKFREQPSEQKHTKYNKSKQFDLFCEEKQKVKFGLDDQSTSHIQRLKKYFCINNKGVNSKNTNNESQVVDDKVGHESKGNSSDSEGSEDQLSDKNPWPRNNFLQLHAINGSINVFRGADITTDFKSPDNQSGKTLIWKLLIKNQKEYIQS